MYSILIDSWDVIDLLKSKWKLKNTRTLTAMKELDLQKSEQY